MKFDSLREKNGRLLSPGEHRIDQGLRARGFSSAQRDVLLRHSDNSKLYKRYHNKFFHENCDTTGRILDLRGNVLHPGFNRKKSVK